MIVESHKKPESHTPVDQYQFVTTTGEHLCGMWSSTPESHGGMPCVSIYHDEQDGPVVGVYGSCKAHPARNCLTCLHTDKKTGEGILQMVTADGECLELFARDLKKLLALLD